MTVTAHFIDEDWKAKSLVLRERKEGKRRTQGRNTAGGLGPVSASSLS